ncbi:MAG TPA: M13-type metalloendopeptidase [Acidimicrobiales bacterium]|nr:M13-type metalloendopeptidase [Acidimicrobiales bacterium]
MNTPSITQRVTPEDLDPEIRPQDDLFHHVNARWMAAVEIPSDLPRYGAFMALRDLSQERVRAILEDAVNAPTGSDARKFADLYTSFLDEAGAEERGAAPIARFLATIEALDSREGLASAIATLQREGALDLFSMYVTCDPGNPERYLVVLGQSGFSLPDESYYREEHFADVRDAFVAHVETMFTLAGFDEAKHRANNVMALESQLASHHWDTVRSRDRDQNYNPMAFADLASLFVRQQEGPAVSLESWRESFDAPEGSFAEVIVSQPSFFEGAGALLASSELSVVKDWMRFHVITSFAPYLSEAFSSANFDFYGRKLTGTPEQRPRWKRGVSLVEGVLGEAVGKAYVERHFPSAAKAEMDELVAWLLAAYAESIASLDWMSDATRQRALEKLALFTPKIGFPRKWRDFSSLEIAPDDLIGNISRAYAFELDRELGKIGAAVDRDEWAMLPQTVNACYSATFNDITFPAAILQPPFFDPERDAAENFGAIGAVIGHEIGHGFDDQGSKSDGTGKRNDWWSDEDRAAFNERTAKLIAQYDALSPRQTPELHVNGAFTVGENIGDLGGAGIAWKAYLLSLGGAEPPVIDGMSGAQRFFYAWALAWQGKHRDADVEFLLTVDPHSPNEFRCNQIVRNLDAFYEAFSVTSEDALWLDPADRVTIW